MSEQSQHSNDPTTLIVVNPDTIEQFEHESHDLGAMYEELFKTNPNLALYLRRRASEISSDLTNRELQSKLALELVTLLSNQHGVEGLELMFQLELVESDSTPDLKPYLPPAA